MPPRPPSARIAAARAAAPARVVGHARSSRINLLPTMPVAASFQDFLEAINDDSLDVDMRLHEADSFLLSVYEKFRAKWPRELPSGTRYKMERKYGEAEFEEDLIFRYARDKYQEFKARAFLTQFT